MKTISKTSILLATTFIVAGTLSAQAEATDDRGGLWKRLFGERREERKEFREERKDDRQEFRQDVKGAREDLKQGIKERRDFMASTTATGTVPTPWKDFRKEIKEVKKDFIKDRKEDIKNFKEEKREDIRKFIGAGFLQNATATAMLAQKLGTTTAALQQMAVSGTLHTFMKTKVGSDDINKFIPRNILGTTTLNWATNTPITFTITQGTTTISTTTLPKVSGWKGFLNRWFGR
jgi:hypothetical protein